jgi:hypothetical protein
MSRINMRRVILGGIAAGVVINVGESILNLVVLGADMEAAMARLNLPPIGGQAIGVFVFMGFVVGILTTWLYAAIRPRFGPGPKTAMCAGAIVWFFAYFYSGLGMVVMGMFTARLMTIAVAWGLVEILVAAVVGAALYKE